MASATGIPDECPTAISSSSNEQEPLLGRPGDVSQKEDQALVTNLITGTATIAQAGIWILAALVWNAIFSQDLIFFSPHPTGVLLTTQAILLLQPTHTASQKRSGTLAHWGLIVLANLCFISGLVIIEISKAAHPEYRFTSIHGILGLVTYILIFLQASVGVAQYFFPVAVFGSVDNGKKIYKYHRVSGYVVLLLELATVAAATQTAYNKAALHVKLWAVLVAAVLVIGGVGARIKKQKMKIF
ncbi:hypothetical protein PAAG_07144 [Paracoccidioides lutzii Pb01]|uniref:Cytochrome b561 domain-containing protein n=1 Tax=Paracoccidioides lutzii (strain ATCC MYA-826 / Pb01) TaxID=502779 RepID=C1H8Q3_PARBA|nr:hypothetical protein PAAG_07144 [Paracoccidioides lutzii Pb01]EEH36726.2 hypothetical protein PAAG_07144 [Paracoccidioides lutzii Pb01]